MRRVKWILGKNSSCLSCLTSIIWSILLSHSTEDIKEQFPWLAWIYTTIGGRVSKTVERMYCVRLLYWLTKWLYELFYWGLATWAIQTLQLFHSLCLNYTAVLYNLVNLFNYPVYSTMKSKCLSQIKYLKWARL